MSETRKISLIWTILPSRWTRILCADNAAISLRQARDRRPRHPMLLRSPERVEQPARRLGDAGVAATVLPSTGRFPMGRGQRHGVRGVLAAHELLHHGVNCSLSTDNILNPFTPFGHCSLLRRENRYANVCHFGICDGVRGCLDMITNRAAKLLRLTDDDMKIGKSTDLVVLDITTAEQSVAELATPLWGFNWGVRRFLVHRPSFVGAR